MFAKLTGKVDTMLPGGVILDVGGVGYLVACSARTRSEMGATGAPVRLFIDTQVREDAINLYGFIDAEEQEWFRRLISVQGVGAKVALSILSVAAPEVIHRGIAAQDKGVFTAADGVGPKLATRILSELKDKVPEWVGVAAASGTRVAPGPSSGGGAMVGPDGDAISALVNLGYTRADAFTAVMRARVGLEQDNAQVDGVAGLIRLSLAELARGNGTS